MSENMGDILRHAISSLQNEKYINILLKCKTITHKSRET